MSPIISGGNVIEGAVNRGDLLAFPGVELYVDSVNGSATGDGRSWDTAFNTITLAMAEAIVQGGLIGIRGLVRIFVAPGGYNEDVVTPLNTQCPFGQLIAVNPTPGKSFGAAYIYASTAGEPAITVKARGWLIKGFEIAAIANAECIVLDGQSANCNAAGTIIEGCIISGWGPAGSIGIDVIGNGAPHTTIRDCFFDGFLSEAIKCTASGTDQPRYWDIDNCRFVDNANHIKMNPRGFKESVIRNCHFMQVGANRTATIQIDNIGGNACTIGPNNYLSGDYDQGNGGYYAGSNEEWRGNHSQDSENGSAQANPAG
jgi:hypothetical protein